MTIAETARSAGVNVQTLRYYERMGLIDEPRRTASGYRLYEQDTVRVVRFIKRAQALGFSLDEAQALLKLRRTSPSKKAQARAAAGRKLDDIDRKIADLRRMRRALAHLIEACDHDHSLECPILDALDDVKETA